MAFSLLARAAPVPYIPHEAFSTKIQHVVIVTALAGLLSCLMVSFLLIHIVSVAVAPYCLRRRGHAAPAGDGELIFLRRQLGVFVICLFLSDFIQSLSGMIQIRWATHKGIDAGSYCTTQAVTLLAGDLGTCFWNAIVAVHTFNTIVLRRSLANSAVVVLVVVGWSFVVFLSIVGPLAIQTPDRGPFYGLAGNWCFITNNYADARLWIHYVPILVSAFIIFILYTLVFLSLRGNIIAVGRRVSFHRREKSSGSATDANAAQVTLIAKKMLWYPVSYVFIVMPISIARLASLHGDKVPEWVWNFGITMLFLSGFINASIYTATRRALSPIHWSRSFFSARFKYPPPSRAASLSHSHSHAGSLSRPGSPGVFDGRPLTPALFEAKGKVPSDRAVWITREEEQHFSYHMDATAGTYALDLEAETASDSASISRPASALIADTQHKRSVSFPEDAKPPFRY